METTDQITRQASGCGYEPPPPALVPIRIWDNVARDPERKTKPTTCPGYTTSLPEVRQTSYARLHWKTNQLAAWCRGEPTEQQLEAVEVLEASSQALESWLLIPKAKGGGGS